MKTLTTLQKHYKETLQENKKLRRLIYQTNSAIIGGIVGTRTPKKFLNCLVETYGYIKIPLLHGVGWRFEYEVMKFLREKGHSAFLTFGTILEPSTIDVVSFTGMLNIRLNLDNFKRISWEDFN